MWSEFRKYKREIFIATLLFIVMVGSISLFFYSLQQKELNEYKEITLQENKRLLDTVRKQLNRQCDTIFDIKVNQPDVLKIMDKARYPAKRAQARKELYALLESTYRLLHKNGIRQLHFHLPGNISFFRFHKMEKYGDSLKGVRYSIDLVNRTRQVVRGFEEGRIFNGFRNVYPLFFHHRFVGTVEISYSIRAIAEALGSGSGSYYGLLIDKRLVEEKVWKENRKYYLQAMADPGYLWDKKAFSMLYGHDETKFISRLRAFEKVLRKKIDGRLAQNRSFLVPLRFNQKNYIVIFQTLHNIAGKPVGYIVTAKKSDIMALRSLQNRTMFAVLIFVSIFVAAIFFLFLKKEKSIKERLSFISNYDPLTTLLNRRGFELAYETLLNANQRESRPISILFLDIDHFKRINDTYGHKIGDRVLKRLADILKRELRESDIIARWGGEEFVIVLEGSDKERAYSVAEKIRRSVEAYREKRLPPFTISIGVVQVDMSASLEQEIEKADTALYRAKRKGRNRVVLFDE